LTFGVSKLRDWLTRPVPPQEPPPQYSKWAFRIFTVLLLVLLVTGVIWGFAESPWRDALALMTAAAAVVWLFGVRARA
jgi:hypothetical protein